MQTPKNGREAGSYDFGSLPGAEDELPRLARQARVALEAELELLNASGLGRARRILDLACGPGHITIAVARSVPRASVCGVDLSPELISEANRHSAMLGANPNGVQDRVQFKEGSVYALPFDTGAFDFVYARLLFQHLEHPARALAEIHRVLSPAGRIAILDVDDEWFSFHPEPRHFRQFLERARSAQAKHGGDRLVGRKLASMLADAGFSSTRARVQLFDSDSIGMEAFVEITLKFKLLQLRGGVDEVKGEREYRSIMDDLARMKGRAQGYLGVFFVTGQK